MAEISQVGTPIVTPDTNPQGLSFASSGVTTPPVAVPKTSTPPTSGLVVNSGDISKLPSNMDATGKLSSIIPTPVAPSPVAPSTPATKTTTDPSQFTSTDPTVLAESGIAETQIQNVMQWNGIDRASAIARIRNSTSPPQREGYVWDPATGTYKSQQQVTAEAFTPFDKFNPKRYTVLDATGKELIDKAMDTSYSTGVVSSEHVIYGVNAAQQTIDAAGNNPLPDPYNILKTGSAAIQAGQGGMNSVLAQAEAAANDPMNNDPALKMIMDSKLRLANMESAREANIHALAEQQYDDQTEANKESLARANEAMAGNRLTGSPIAAAFLDTVIKQNQRALLNIRTSEQQNVLQAQEAFMNNDIQLGMESAKAVQKDRENYTNLLFQTADLQMRQKQNDQNTKEFQMKLDQYTLQRPGMVAQNIQDQIQFAVSSGATWDQLTPTAQQNMASLVQSQMPGATPENVQGVYANYLEQFKMNALQLKTGIISQYNYAKSQGYTGSLLDYTLAAKGATASSLDPQTVQFAAEQYLTTGTLPSLGFGSGSAKIQVIKAAADLAGQRGLTGQAVALNKVAFDAGAGAIKDLEKRKAVSQAQEESASKAVDLAYNLGNRVDRTGSPFANKYWMFLKGQIAGDSDTLNFEGAVRTAATEYAKVISGQTTGAGVTDAANQETNDILNATYSQDAFKAKIVTMKQDMQFKAGSWNDQIQQIQSEMGGIGGQNTDQSGTQGGFQSSNAGTSGDPNFDAIDFGL